MATIIDGKKRIPFRRGMLTLYLINRGFAYEEADELANAVRTAQPHIRNSAPQTMRQNINNRRYDTHVAAARREQRREGESC